MLKVKKLFLSFVIVFFAAVTIGTLTSCGKDDDITVNDKENFITVKNEYQEYKEQYSNAAKPSGVDIVVDGANYNVESVTTSATGLVTSVSELNITESALNPANGNSESLIKLVDRFIDIKQPYNNEVYQYIFDGLFGEEIKLTNDEQKEAVVKQLKLKTVEELNSILRIINQIKNLINNRKSTTDNVLIHESNGQVSWTVNVEEAGFYNIYLNYFTVIGYSSSIERKLMINNKIPFAGADSFAFSRVWEDADASYDEEGNLKVDTNGNDLKPQQVENYTFRNSYFKDSMGYVTEPYMFYLEAGENEITLYELYDFINKNINGEHFKKWDEIIQIKISRRGFVFDNFGTFYNDKIKFYYKISLIISLILYAFFLSILDISTAGAILIGLPCFFTIEYNEAKRLKVMSSSGFYEHQKIKALKKFLKHFSIIDERSPEYSQILDDYIVYANIFDLQKTK